jgi:hypothetical protein
MFASLTVGKHAVKDDAAVCAFPAEAWRDPAGT